MPGYKHIFFDLDRTLWDYERCARETIKLLLGKTPELKNVELSAFYPVFDKINEDGWLDYLAGSTTKEQMRLNRFAKTLAHFSISNEKLAASLAEEFISVCPAMPHLMEGTLETLEYLTGKYQMHILTNGFSDIQYKKLKNSGIEKYFSKVFTSDALGYCKPDKRMFHYALTSLNATRESSLMVGDDYKIDIEGAMNCGIDQVWLNTNNLKCPKKPNFLIQQINELKGVL